MIGRTGEAAPMLATIGYDGRPLATYLSTLVGARVHVLYDVRRNAISRKRGRRARAAR